MKLTHVFAFAVLFLTSASVATAGPKAVFLIGEREYETKTTLPAFAAAELIPRGYECVYVHAEGDEGEARDIFPGVDAIDTADLLVLSTRRRTLPTEDLDRVRKHVASGKPVIAIRTACHGFALRNGEPPAGKAQWKAFDREVMGVRYDNHLRSHDTTYEPTDADHPVLEGVTAEAISSQGTLYRMYELADDATLLLNGTGQDGDQPETYPAAWVRTAPTGSRVFATTIGHVSDFKSPALRKMLVNACAWCLDDKALAVAPTTADLAATYGFGPVEVYELDWRTFGIQAGDFNGDGLKDLVAVDNRKSRLALFQQRPDGKESASSERTNAIVDPGRFEQRSVLVDRAVTSLTVGDVNGDGRDDLVTLEKPERLVVRLQTDTGFDEAQTIQIAELGEGPFDVDAADLDNDGDADVVAVTERATVLLESRGEQGLAPGVEHLNTSDEVNLFQLVDVDGDGRLDWFYTASDSAGSFLSVRRQLSTPRDFGPELRLTEDEYRALALAEADGRPGSEFFAVDSQTGRIEVLRYAVDSADEERPLSDGLTQFGLTDGRQDRSAASGDFDGDGRLDLVVSNPNAAELLLFRQGPAGLQPGERCATFLGVAALAAADFDQDGRDDVTLISEAESTIGVASWNVEKDSLQFPTVLTADEIEAPKALAIPAYVAEHRRGFVVAGDVGRSATATTTYAFKDGQWVPDKTISAVGQTSGLADQGVLPFDADHDGRTDFLFVPKRSNPTLFTSNDDGSLSEVTGGLSLPRVDKGQVVISQDNSSILVTQKKFVRRMSLDEERNWQVDEQWNVPTSDSSFAAAIEFGPAEEPYVAAYDEQRGRLFVFSGAPVPQSIDVGRFQLKSLIAGDFDGDARDDIVLVGAERLGLVRSSGVRPTLKPILTFESDDEKAYFADVVAGDINHDQITDLVVNETRQHTIALVALRDGATTAKQAVRFKLFEEKSFSSSREQPGLQPREMIIADVTGDGRNDLIMLCHDRLLLHPQDGPQE